jgi:hypothetical protein
MDAYATRANSLWRVDVLDIYLILVIGERKIFQRASISGNITDTLIHEIRPSLIQFVTLLLATKAGVIDSNTYPRE